MYYCIGFFVGARSVVFGDLHTFHHVPIEKLLMKQNAQEITVYKSDTPIIQTYTQTLLLLYITILKEGVNSTEPIVPVPQCRHPLVCCLYLNVIRLIKHSAWFLFAMSLLKWLAYINTVLPFVLVTIFT